MTNAEDTHPSPVETPLVDDTTVPVAKPDAGIQKTCQLPQVLDLLNWKIWLLPLPYRWISWLVLTLQLAVQ